MKVRLILLLLLFAAAVGFSFRNEAKPKMEEANLLFLDFLNANARGELDKAPLQPSNDVVLVEFRGSDKAEFSTWPPAPLDYIMVLKRLAEHNPDIVAVTDVLHWDKPDVQFTTELQQTFLRFSSAALAFTAKEVGNEKVDSAIHEDVAMPKIAKVVGNPKLAPRLGQYDFPAKNLRPLMQLGFVLPEAKQDASVPLVARAGDTLVPSLAAQILALREHAPYISQRLRFGRGAGLYLGGSLFVPLADDGTVTPKLDGGLMRVSAVDLMAPALQDPASQAVETKLGSHKVILIGMASPAAEAQARAVAWALALPKLNRAPVHVEWIAAAVAALLGLWQLRFHRFGALIFGLLVVAALLGISLAVFQSTRIWWAPALPASLTAIATLFCFLWPRSRKHETLPPPAEVAPETPAENPA
jgi:hypothetical protein